MCYHLECQIGNLTPNVKSFAHYAQKKLTGEDCNVHISKRNLENITSKFITILKQSDTISADWERKKELHLGNQGYLNIAANSPEIMEEISNIT